MRFVNLFGLAVIAAIMVPNFVFAAMHKDGFENLYKNKAVEFLEQVGRFGCFAFMIFCVPVLCRGFCFDGAKTVYFAASSALTVAYLCGWCVFWKENSLRKSIMLSVVPSLLFLESGFFTLNIPLIVCAVIFSPCHILISCKNAEMS
ncbi:MAG: hypothetical protein Q4P16_01840 [Spirochaetales bacterium]|nr:hypothetical protein [Spirochaetales bacterium]